MRTGARTGFSPTPSIACLADERRNGCASETGALTLAGGLSHSMSACACPSRRTHCIIGSWRLLFCQLAQHPDQACFELGPHRRWPHLPDYCRRYAADSPEATFDRSRPSHCCKWHCCLTDHSCRRPIAPCHLAPCLLKRTESTQLHAVLFRSCHCNLEAGGRMGRSSKGCSPQCIQYQRCRPRVVEANDRISTSLLRCMAGFAPLCSAV